MADTERNKRVQARYDELMKVGRHGHYETLFQVVREEVERTRATPTALTDAGDNNEVGYRLVLSFDGLYPSMPEEHAFVHGFEFAQLWIEMRDGKRSELVQVSHLENRTIIERAAAALGWAVEFIPYESGTWMLAKLHKVHAERQNPHGLRVVT